MVVVRRYRGAPGLEGFRGCQLGISATAGAAETSSPRSGPSITNIVAFGGINTDREKLQDVHRC
jgi:hypothetical protein